MALYSNYLYTIRHRLSEMMRDCILCTVSAGTTTTATIATTDPPHFYNKDDDYFNDKFEVYCYSGTNTGVSRLVTDWVNLTRILDVWPAAGSSYDTTSKLELHGTFTRTELNNAINQAIESVAGIYLVDLKDETSIILEEAETNDGNTIYTYEYDLPTSLLYIHRVMTEDNVAGKKLTGTISGAFTLGEKVTGSISVATGILSYGPSGGTYILVREVEGTFVTGETATGAGGKTCSAITAVEDETVGDGRFSEIVDPRYWAIIKSYEPKIKFKKDYYTVIGDLRIRLEGQGSQAAVSSDTDNIFLPPDWLVLKAVTFLPYSKIESNNLLNTFKMALAKKLAASAIQPGARGVIE